MKRLESKNVLLGVTGSIAAYKACEVLRRLVRDGAQVQVVMTRSAQHFVGPITFETLSGRETVRELFPDHRIMDTRHVSLADWAHCLLVCPATANFIGKAASGIADDFLSTVIMAARSVVVLAPAMDYQMVRHPVYLDNCEKLRKIGYRFVDPEKGELASGAIGSGRLADVERILHAVRRVLFQSDGLQGKRVLVTAGPTREPLDPVRYLTNRSSGKMGFSVAEEALFRGASVTLIAGPTRLQGFDGMTVRNVETAQEMAQAVDEEWADHDILVMAAAVSDYRPYRYSPQKIKKRESSWTLDLEANPDILRNLSRKGRHGTIVGFALETEEGENRAFEKLKEKRLDLICLNNPLEPGSGFDGDTNRVVLIDRNGSRTALPLLPKWEVARRILDRVEEFVGKRGKPIGRSNP